MTERETVIRKLLERYHELTELSESGDGRGDGGSLTLTPHEKVCALLSSNGRGNRCTCAYRSVREVERLLGVMRESRGPLVQVGAERVSVRALRWHAVGWYVNARRVVKHYPVKFQKGRRVLVPSGQEILRDNSGAFVPTVTQTSFERTRGARRELAEAAVTWIAAAWSLQSEPMLPSDVFKADRDP